MHNQISKTLTAALHSIKNASNRVEWFVESDMIVGAVVNGRSLKALEKKGFIRLVATAKSQYPRFATEGACLVAEVL